MSDTPLSSDWDIPPGLTRKGKEACELIRRYALKHQLADTGGCVVFYSPSQWQARGESYGTDSLLIICHDGGEHSTAFNLDKGDYANVERLSNKLNAIDVFSEQCTCWYSAIYLI